MTVIAPSAPRGVRGRVIDILDTPVGDGMVRGFARVNPQDPVFFDHPLDHVPGMLLAVAMLELAEHASLLDPERIVFTLTFTRFCELGAPVEVTAQRETRGALRLESVQDARAVAKASLAPSDIRPPAQYAPVPALRDDPVDGELVHRTDLRNVALGPLTVEQGRVWARVREESAIRELRTRTRGIACVLEAARQFAIAILHRWGGQPPGIKMIFVGLTSDLPTAECDAVHALSWEIAPPDQTHKLHIDVHASDGRVGSVLIVSRCVDGDQYAQLRAG